MQIVLLILKLISEVFKMIWCWSSCVWGMRKAQGTPTSLPSVFTSVCMVDVFLSLPFQSACVFRSYLLQTWFLFFIYSITPCLLIGAFTPFTLKVIIERYILSFFFVICFLVVFVVLCSFFSSVALFPSVWWLSLVLCLDYFLFIFCVSHVFDLLLSLGSYIIAYAYSSLY